MKRAIHFNVPLSACNLRCHYCYIGQRAEGHQGKIPQMRFSPSEVGYAMRQERLGGPSFFNITASGETLLLPHLQDYVAALVDQGHYVEIVSNMTIAPRLMEVLSIGRELLSHVEFKCSLHFLELERRGLLDVFAENVNKAWDAGASITVEVTPSDELMPRIDDLKEYSIQRFGALPHLTIARDDRTAGIERLTALSKHEYDAIWSQFGSELFGFKSEIFGVRRREFCHAGLWSCHADLSTGMARQCLCGGYIGNLFDQPDNPIEWRAIGRCQLPHCYNGHAYLAFGCIPGIDITNYANERDRARQDGSHWLRPELRKFFEGKLYEENSPLTATERLRCKLWSTPRFIWANMENLKRR